MIDSANDPGRYDQEVFLALREWEYFLSPMDQDEMAPDPNDPMPEKPATPDLRPNGLEVSAPLYSINDKMLGAGDPLRVQPGQRVLMHLLNASAAANSSPGFARPQVSGDRSRRQSRAHASVGGCD